MIGALIFLGFFGGDKEMFRIIRLSHEIGGDWKALMYRIYCAFSGALNRESFGRKRQVHICKIGSTNMSKKDREERMR